MVGEHRRWDDTNERRFMGPIPQEQNIAGLPAPTRKLRQGTVREGFYERENPIDERIAQALATQSTGESKPVKKREGLLAGLDRVVASLTGKAETNTAEQVLSAEIGRPVSRETANLAREYVDILGISPAKGVEIAETLGRKGINTLPPSLIKEIVESGELKPDLAAQNAVLAASKGNLPEEAASIKLRGEPFRSIGGSELSDLQAEQGAGRNLRGGRRNPLDKNIQEVVVDGYRVPVLVGDEVERKKAPPTKDKYGKTVWAKGDAAYARDADGNFIMQVPMVKSGEKVQTRSGWEDWDRKRFDTRAAQVAMVDPTALVSGVRRSDPTVASDERSGKNKGVPTIDPTTGRDLVGITPDIPSVPHGLSAAEDPARTTEYVQMTLAEAVEDIRLNHRTPIKTLRRGEDTYMVEEDGAVKEYLKYTAPDGNEYKTDLQVFEYNKNYPDNPELVDYRIGSPTEITNEGMEEFSRLMKEVPGLENKTILANQKIDDSAVNRAQNALLQDSISEEWRSNYVKGDPNAKPTHDLMKAIARANTVQPSESNQAPVYISNTRLNPEGDKESGLYQYGKGTDLANKYKAEIANYLRATPANKEVQSLRAKYQADPRTSAANEMASNRPQTGATNSAQISQLNAPESTPPATPNVPVKSYEKFADALGSEVGSPAHDYAMKAMAQRIKARMNRS
tara:strand:- start:10083 stop:12131 length:2049 start_codon:yes stop_codon:yes gene_type:complete